MAVIPLEHTDNPILWQEQVHQQRHTPRQTARFRLLTAILLVTLLGAILVSLVQSNGGSAIQMALFTVWGLQIAVSLRAITAGANTISREHVGLTWDTLVLTGISARKILYGKLQAALNSVRDLAVILAIVRLAMLPIFSYGLFKLYLSFVVNYNNTFAAGSYEAPQLSFSIVVWAWCIAILASLTLTVLEALISTLLGMACSAIMRRSIPAAILAIGIRFAPVIVFAAFMRYQLGVTFFWRWWGNTAFSLSDSGSSAIMVLAFPLIPWTEGDHEAALPGLILVMGIIALVTLIALGVTHWIIRREGALP